MNASLEEGVLATKCDAGIAAAAANSASMDHA
jgi:hypothetical protein